MCMKLIQKFSLLLFLSMQIACETTEVNPNDAKAAFQAAREAYDDEYFEMALPKLQEFRARFPYSRYSTEAELLIGDSYFQMDQFPEAAAVYNQFAKLHPEHPRADFALFRVGLCYWEESPDDRDRDQEFTTKAIDIWDELLVRFPKSKFLSEAKEKQKAGKRRLADADHFVAEFYCKQKKWGACALRSMTIIESHAQYKDLVKQAAKFGQIAFLELAKSLETEKIKTDANVLTRNLSASKLRAKSIELGKLYSKL